MAKEDINGCDEVGMSDDDANVEDLNNAKWPYAVKNSEMTYLRRIERSSAFVIREYADELGSLSE